MSVLITGAPGASGWGWKPEFTDIEKVVAYFIQEVRTRPQVWGV